MIDSKTKRERKSAREVFARIEQYPELEALFEEYIDFEEYTDIVENARGDVVKAWEAEEQFVDLMRRMGRSGIQGWAQRKQRKIEAESDERS